MIKAITRNMPDLIKAGLIDINGFWILDKAEETSEFHQHFDTIENLASELYEILTSLVEGMMSTYEARMLDHIIRMNIIKNKNKLIFPNGYALKMNRATMSLYQWQILQNYSFAMHEVLEKLIDASVSIEDIKCVLEKIRQELSKAAMDITNATIS